MIPDSCVTLPSTPFGMALVMSKKHPPNKYWVHDPKSKWASCDYPWAQRGNKCKHQVKVLQLLQPELTEGTIAHYYGALKEIIERGLKICLVLHSIHSSDVKAT
jgi:hypothetical protein